MTPPRRSLRKSKKQTQLIFSPLPSSSPVSSKVAEQFGERSYAGVRFEISPARKRRKTNAEGNRGSGEEGQALPTPGASSFSLPSGRFRPSRKLSGTPTRSSSIGSQPIEGTKRKRRPHQGQLDFASHLGVTLDEGSVNTPYKMRSRGRLDAGIFGTQPKRNVKTKATAESSEDELTLSIHPPRATTGSRSHAAVQKSPIHHDRSARKARTTIVLESSEESGSDESVGKPDTGSKEDDTQEESSGDELPVVQSSPTHRKSRKLMRKNLMPDFIELSSSDESTGTVLSVAVSSNRRRNQVQSSQDDDDEESDEVRAVSRTGRRIRTREIEDLDEDLEFLKSSPPAYSKQRNNPKSVVRRDALEQLKRRRAGQAAAMSTPSASSHVGGLALDHGEDESDDEEEEEEVEYVDNRRDMFLPEDEDQEFVVEDDPNDLIGAPDIAMPLEFSHMSRAKPKDLFKYVVEWMVQKKINPAFAINDEVYDLAFKKCDDEVRGLAGSKFTSSAWTAGFTTSLQARPGIILTESGGISREILSEHCEACNRSGHPATWDVQFYGKPYHPITLEDVENEDSEDSEHGDDGEDAAEYDSRGRFVPSEDKVYHCGRFCKDNASNAHALHHWRYHLNEYVVDYLKETGHLTPEKIVTRDSLSTRKRREEANSIVDEMAEVGKINELYRGFRDEIDTARESKSARFSHNSRT